MMAAPNNSLYFSIEIDLDKVGQSTNFYASKTEILKTESERLSKRACTPSNH